MTTIYKYRVYCTTDSKYEYVWAETEPTACPVNTAHTIDTNTITIVDTRDENITTIQEESTPTGGNFRAIGKSLDILANETKIDDNVWDYNISALAIGFNSDTDNQGDNIELIVGPDTVIGAITSNVSISDTVINVSSTVLDHAMVGFRINLFDGVNTEDLGEIISIDETNKTLTFSGGSSQAFSAASPTYVRMSVYVVQNFVIGKPGPWEVGQSKIGGSFVPAGTIIRIIYYNNTASAKNFTAQLEYLY